MNTNQLPSTYLALIQQTFTELELREVEIITEGMVNDVVVVNHERVFRFARNPDGEEGLDYEGKAIDFIRPFLRLDLPQIDFRSKEMISYPLIKGIAFSNSLALRFTEVELDRLALDLGRGMHDLHHIPVEEAKKKGLNSSPTLVKGINGWKNFFHKSGNILVPHLGATQKREFMQLELYIHDRSFLKFTPTVVHGDICSDHILVDPNEAELAGIIDWGTAGIGDPAGDYVGIVFELGESFLQRMAKADPDIPSMLEKIRFWVRTMNWQVLLKYYETLDPAWLEGIHLYNRDLRPVGSGWDE